MMQSLDTITLTRYVARQLNNLLPDSEIAPQAIAQFVKKAIQRTEYCFSKVNNRYFFDGKNILFNHLNTDQYAVFLYYLSNTIWRKEKDDTLASKVYYLNKALHGLDAFYEVNLPDIFLLVHPIGTALGKGVAMYGGSALIGRCKVGDNCLISVGTIVMERDIPPDMVVFGRYPDISYKRTKKSVIERYFVV